MNKKIIFAICVLILATIFFGYKKSLIKTNNIQNKKIVIGLDDAFPPIGFRNEKSELVGFDIDLAKETFKRLDIEIEFKPVIWDSVILTLTKGDIDLIWNGMTITEKRQEQIIFSIPYLKGQDIYLVDAKSNLKNKIDLKDKIIGVQAGSSQDESLKNDSFSKSFKEIKSYEDIKAALLDLKVGRVDAVFVDNFSGLYTAKTLLKDSVKIESIDSENETTFAGVGIRKNDEKLKENIDRIIKEMRKDGTMSRIAVKWFGNDEMIVK